MNHFPLITAHTGCDGTPENSMLSAVTGLALGADIIEDDIRITRDGVPILSHNDFVLLKNSTKGSIASLTLPELNDNLIEPITVLEPVLEVVCKAGKLMNLDLKTDDCIGPVSELVERLGYMDQVFLTGCEYERALRVSLYNKRLPWLLNVDIGLFSAVNDRNAIIKSCEDARNAGCMGINIPYQLASADLLDRASHYELPVYVWTVNDEVQMKQFAQISLYSITTRRVKDLVRLRCEMLEEKPTGGP